MTDDTKLAALSAMSEFRTTTELEPFAILVPDCPGARDSGERWWVQRIEEAWSVEQDGFGRVIFDQDSHDWRAYGRKLTKRNILTGAQHLLPWFHDEQGLLAARIDVELPPPTPILRESNTCQRGTVGCSVNHGNDDGDCDSW